MVAYMWKRMGWYSSPHLLTLCDTLIIAVLVGLLLHSLQLLLDFASVAT